MIDPGLEMRRLAGKFALLFAGVYVLGVFGTVVTAITAPGIPPWGWLLLALTHLKGPRSRVRCLM